LSYIFDRRIGHECNTLEDGRSANGLLARTQRTVGGQLTYDRIFLYDTLLKPAGHDTALDADLIAGGTLQTFTLTQKLDSYFGRVISVTDPEFRGRGEYRYNRDGYLQNVKAHLRNSDNTIRSQTVKTVHNLSARGQVVNVSFGNGLTDSRTYYPQTGQVKTMKVGNAFQGAGAVLDLGYGYDKYLNLTSQFNAKIGISELYSYDRLHRLTSRSGPQEISTTPIDPTSPSSAGTESDGTQAPIGPDPKPVVTAGGADYAYDPLGNLTNKSDYATGYTYGQLFTALQVAGCNNDGRGFRTTVAPGPHAVTELSVNAQGVASDPLGGGTTSGTPTLHQLAYDKNGNLLCFGDGSLNLWYDPYNLPAKIQRFNQMQEFRYGPDLQRYLQVAAGVTTVYLERSYEKEVASGKVRFQIAEDVLVRMATGQNPVIDYQHRDRQGSIVAVTDEGTAIERGTERGFGPFGNPRDANWNDQNILPGSDITPRGFTDHEHLNGSRLIHMNGRAYDYNLGRFLSVDPVIQFPANSQSLNPYSYIMNNPLSGTDPTGYMSCLSDVPDFCPPSDEPEGGDRENPFTTTGRCNRGSACMVVQFNGSNSRMSSEDDKKVIKFPDQIGATDNRTNTQAEDMGSPTATDTTGRGLCLTIVCAGQFIAQKVSTYAGTGAKLLVRAELAIDDFAFEQGPEVFILGRFTQDFLILPTETFLEGLSEGNPLMVAIGVLSAIPLEGKVAGKLGSAVTRGGRLFGVAGRGVLDLTERGIGSLLERSLQQGTQLARRFARPGVREQLGVGTQGELSALLRRTLETGSVRAPGIQPRFPSVSVFSQQTGVVVNINADTGLIVNAFRPTAAQLEMFFSLTPLP